MEMEAREMRDPREFVQRSRRGWFLGKRPDDAIDPGAVIGLSDRFHVRNLPGARAGFFAGIAEFEAFRFRFPAPVKSRMTSKSHLYTVATAAAIPASMIRNET
jgi:hypothetical protein